MHNDTFSPPASEAVAHDLRWQEWQVKHARSNRSAARNSRIVAVIVLGAAAVWVLMELLASPAFAG